MDKSVLFTNVSFLSAFQLFPSSADTIQPVRVSLSARSPGNPGTHVLTEEDVFFIPFSGDSNGCPGDRAQHHRLFLVQKDSRVRQLFSASSGFLPWTPKSRVTINLVGNSELQSFHIYRAEKHEFFCDTGPVHWTQKLCVCDLLQLRHFYVFICLARCSEQQHLMHC